MSVQDSRHSIHVANGAKIVWSTASNGSFALHYRAMGLRGRKYCYYESATTVHFSDLSRYVEPLCAAKDRKNILAVALSRYGYLYRADTQFRGTIL
jgi:hypothetical protein